MLAFALAMPGVQIVRIIGLVFVILLLFGQLHLVSWLWYICVYRVICLSVLCLHVILIVLE